MTDLHQPQGAPIANGWRIARWGAAAALLAVPLVAMQFTREVNWDAFDFIVVGTMLAAVCGTYEALARPSCGAAYRAALALTLVGIFLLLWIDGAVGIIGSEQNDANLMFPGLIAMGVVGAVVGRFHATAMARALLAMAVAQVAVGGVALAGGLGADGPGWPGDVIGLTAGFTALWALAGWGFRRAART